jgi:NAD(P)-dependent dehydrogenase (short-subunit alcohol dehydrogenase family)
MQDFRDKVAVITGGANGIGRAIADELAAEGCHLVIADIEQEHANEAASELREKGIRAVGVKVDVASLDSVQALADAAYAEFGSVHLLFNNAGVVSFGPLSALTPGDWRWIQSVNADGVANGLMAFLPRMSEQEGERHIVNTASIAGLFGFPNIGVYTASKYAVVGLSEVLHAELAGSGIGVSVVCPGGVATRIVDAARNRPANLGGPAEGPAEMRDQIMEAMPADVAARKILDGIRANELYILTHPETKVQAEERFNAILAAYDRQS